VPSINCTTTQMPPFQSCERKKENIAATAVRRAPSIAQPGTWPKRQHAYALCQPGTQIVYHCMDQCQNDGPTRVGQSPGPEKECTDSITQQNTYPALNGVPSLFTPPTIHASLVICTPFDLPLTPFLGSFLFFLI
jgi:hypothetical protein